MSIHLALPTCRRYGLTSVTWDQGEIAWEPATAELTERERRFLARSLTLAVLHADSRRTGKSQANRPWRLVVGDVVALAPVPREASDAA